MVMIPAPKPEYDVVWSGGESLDKFQAKFEEAPKPKLSPLAEFFQDVRHYPLKDHYARKCPSCSLVYVVTNSKIENVCEGCWAAPKLAYNNKRYEKVCVVCGLNFQGISRSKRCTICRNVRHHSSREENKLVALARAEQKLVAQAKREEHDRLHNLRSDLWWSYDLCDKPQLGEYLAGVYAWQPGEIVETPCEHRHNACDTVIWCKNFPDVSPPRHVVVVSCKTDRVIRSLDLR